MGVYYPKALARLDVLTYDYGDESLRREFVLPVQPISVSVNINSYRHADTASVSVRFEDVPFDPRLIRSVRVRIIIKDLKTLTSISEESLSDDEDILFIGFADQHSIVLDSADRTVTLECRDYTSLFIDTRYDDANLPDATGKRTLKISKNQSIVKILEDIISNVPGAGAIKVDDRTGGLGAKSFARAVPGYDLLNGKKSSDGLVEYVNQNRTYWDVIVGVCEASGFICYIEKDVLVLTNPRVLFQGTHQTSDSAQFIYGHNISQLNFRRNLGRKKKFNIVVRSHNRRTGRTLNVSIPKDATQEWSRTFNIDNKVSKISEIDTAGVRRERNAPGYVFPIPDATREQMIEYGEKVFIEFVKQQLEGECETYEMSVKNSMGSNFDLTKIKVGTPILIDITPEDIKHIMRWTPTGDKISDGDRLNYLLRKGYKKNVAQDMINAISKGQGKLRPTFYAADISMSLTQQGWSMRIGFINFIQLGEVAGGVVRSG